MQYWLGCVQAWPRHEAGERLREARTGTLPPCTLDSPAAQHKAVTIRQTVFLCLAPAPVSATRHLALTAHATADAARVHSLRLYLHLHLGLHRERGHAHADTERFGPPLRHRCHPRIHLDRSVCVAQAPAIPSQVGGDRAHVPPRTTHGIHHRVNICQGLRSLGACASANYLHSRRVQADRPRQRAVRERHRAIGRVLLRTRGPGGLRVWANHARGPL